MTREMIAALRDETKERLLQTERLANTTRSAEAWRDYIASCRYYKNVLHILDESPRGMGDALIEAASHPEPK